MANCDEISERECGESVHLEGERMIMAIAVGECPCGFWEFTNIRRLKDKMEVDLNAFQWGYPEMSTFQGAHGQPTWSTRVWFFDGEQDHFDAAKSVVEEYFEKLTNDYGGPVFCVLGVEKASKKSQLMKEMELFNVE